MTCRMKSNRTRRKDIRIKIVALSAGEGSGLGPKDDIEDINL